MERFEVFVVLLVGVTSSVLARECIQEGQCVCRLDDGSGVIDLSGIGLQDGTPLINLAASSPVDPYLYSFNPCFPFTQGTCTNVAGCQFDEKRSTYYDIGDANSASLAYDDKGKSLVATYTSHGGQKSRTTIVRFICDPAVETPKYTVEGEPSPAFYEFKITSKFACKITPHPTSPLPSTTAKRECYKIDQCRCEFNDGSGIMDLSVVGRNDGTPLINQEYLPDNFTYSFNPCYAFKEGPCKTAAACQHSLGDTTLYYNIGDHTKVSFSYDGVNVVGTYLSDDLSRKSIVTYTCNPNMVIPAYTVKGEIAYSTYGFAIIGKDICPRPAVISTPTSPSTTMMPPISTTRIDIKKQCIQTYQCECEFNDGSGVVDLAKIGLNNGEPLINKAFAADNFAYSFNPCYSFNEGTCVNAAGFRITSKYACPSQVISVPNTTTVPSSSVHPSRPSVNPWEASTTRIDIKKQCIQTNQCQCEFNDGSGVVDLAKIGLNNGEPLINKAFAADNFAYSFNPCYSFNVGTCVNAAACQFDATNAIYYNIGDSSKVEFSFNGVNVIGRYLADDGARTSLVTYICDMNVNFPTYSVDGEISTAVYGFRITSKYACPSKQLRSVSTSKWDRSTSSTEQTRSVSSSSAPRSISPTNPWDRSTSSTDRTRTASSSSPSIPPFNPWDRSTSSSVRTRTVSSSPPSIPPFNPWDRSTSSSVRTLTVSSSQPSIPPFNPWDRSTSSSVRTRTASSSSPSIPPFNPWDRFTSSSVRTRTASSSSPSIPPFNPWDRSTSSSVRTRTASSSPPSIPPFNPWDRSTSSTERTRTVSSLSPSISPFNPWDRSTSSTVRKRTVSSTSPSMPPFNPWDRFTSSTVRTRTASSSSPSIPPFNPWDRSTSSTVRTRTVSSSSPSIPPFNPWDRSTSSTERTRTVSSSSALPSNWSTNPWDRFSNRIVSARTKTSSSRSSFNTWDTTIWPSLSTIRTYTSKKDSIPFVGDEDIGVDQTIPIIVGCSITMAIVLLVGFILYYCKYNIRSRIDDQEMQSVPGLGDKGNTDYRRF